MILSGTDPLISLDVLNTAIDRINQIQTHQNDNTQLTACDRPHLRPHVTHHTMYDE